MLRVRGGVGRPFLGLTRRVAGLVVRAGFALARRVAGLGVRAGFALARRVAGLGVRAGFAVARRVRGLDVPAGVGLPCGFAGLDGIEQSADLVCASQRKSFHVPTGMVDRRRKIAVHHSVFRAFFGSPGAKFSYLYGVPSSHFQQVQFAVWWTFCFRSTSPSHAACAFGEVFLA